MATIENNGFRLNQLFQVKNMPRFIQSLSKIDFDVDDIISQSRLSEPTGKKFHYSEDDIYGYLYDSKPTEYDNIPYFSKNYNQRKRDLYFFCSHPEIEFIIHSIGHDAVVYDERNFFLSPLFDPSYKEEITSKLNQRFKQIYQSLGFNDGFFAWEKFVDFLKIGYYALEIVYDNPYNPKEIIGFEELDPETLVPFYKDIEIMNNGIVSKRKTKLWKQITSKNGRPVERILSDNSVIFIQYNRVPGNVSRLAYSERLIRSFNLKRTIENCKVAYQVMNSQFRLKIVVPVGTRNSDKAKQALAAVNNKYKEDVTIDTFSGEVFMNGQPLMNFGKTITLPSRNGQEPVISSIAYDGPDLSSMDIVKHFERGLWRDSIMPFNRFDKDNGGGTTVVFSEDGLSNDDMYYYNFINTVRKEFEQVIKKPLYLQACMDFPHLAKDQLFKAKFGFEYNSDSMYRQAKEEQIEDHKLDRIGKMMQLKDGETPIFDIKYLITKKYALFTPEEFELAKNKNYGKPPEEETGGGGGGDAAPPGGDEGGGQKDTPVDEPDTSEFTPPA